MKKKQINRQRHGPPDRLPPDYNQYHFSPEEWLRVTLVYVVLDAVVSYLFFCSWLAFLLLLPGIWFYVREEKKRLLKRRKDEMQRQFLTGMQLVGTSLQAGYAVENAFREAVSELEKIYREDAFILWEFKWITKQLGLNRTAEALLLDLGKRSGVEDIRSFAEVFYTAKRTGGDLMAITRNTVESIRQKQETQQEIDTCLSGKIMEQKLMSVIPLFILAYVSITSPGFLDVMYQNVAGQLVMAGCLFLYVLAFLWGRKVVDIRL